ncbi:MAG: hypothetical protein ACK5JR_18050 [Tropicimonas sp.]|uniref:hypothetical protein n=1 Tax=Tropicimonas sp. TaxID=2067044 RepID=UPI003A8C8561
MSENPKVAAAATEKSDVRLDRLILIGTFGADSDRYALVRHASGRIMTIRAGEKLDGRRVVGIGKGEVVLQSGSRQTRLSMPSG